MSLDERRAKINKTVDHGIRAVCFDLDGVLVDAADWHKEALDKALVYWGYEPLSYEDHMENFNGLSTKRKLEILASRGSLTRQHSLLHDGLHCLKQSFTVDIIKEKCNRVERVVEAVILAHKTFRGRIAVVTNCSRPTAELMLKNSGLFDLFKFIISNEDVDGNIKPHPWPYTLAFNNFNLVRPRQILAIDDTQRGITSASNAGMRIWHLKKFNDLTADNFAAVLDSYRITI